MKIFSHYHIYRKSAGMITKAFLLLAALSFSTLASGQVDCNTSIACNDTIQVSLEFLCDAKITPDMMLEGQPYHDSVYLVVITDKDGFQLPNDTVDGTYIGQSLNVSVELMGCENSCWGVINIEDKLAPTVDNCVDATIQCDDSREPGDLIPQPVFFDVCSGDLIGTYHDEVEDQPCQGLYAQIITRTWMASDESGNTVTCVQTISVIRNNIEDTVFPENFDGLANPAFECTDDIKLLPNGAPHPDITGYPTGIDCPNIQYVFDDLVFELCGSSKKILRRWTVFDWCTGRDTMAQQIIKVLDTMAPVCPSDGQILYETTTDLGLCTGTFTVPPPNVTKECSGYTYIVGYKPYEEGGDPYTGIIYNEASIDANGIYTISQIPLDTSWLVYTITDECGHQSMCYERLVVKDGESPTAICEGYTVITLDNHGNADLFAESIDDGSWDNCDIDRYEIKRDTSHCNILSDLIFGEYVNFCCDDTEKEYIKVTMRVYDKYENYNDCKVHVKVQDKIPPEIECPRNVTINCTEDKDSLDITGEATATDACEVKVTYSDNLNDLNDCGVGTIIRTWIATDQQGRISTCVQNIEVVSEFPFNQSSIDWPDDVTIDGCKVIDADPEGEAKKPEVKGDECLNIAMAYEDKKFYGTEGVCLKIIRTWRVTDWCTFDPHDPFYFYHVQKIVLDNNEAPEFISGCSNKTAEANGCSGYIELSAVASDDCTPEGELDYSWEIDIDNNGDINYKGSGNNASGIYDAGTHKVTFYVEDICENVDSCSFLFSILDNKAPSPICIAELVWVLDADGKATVWASDFDLKSTDGCSDDDDLRFAFNAAGTATNLDFDCLNVPNGIAAEIPLKMYVFDESGNYEYCDVLLILQDSPNNDGCTDDLSYRATIAGNIINETHEGLTDVEVELENMSVQDYLMNKTDDLGKYGFSDVEFFDTYHIDPFKNDDITNGVSTLDLVFIQQYILGSRKFDSPYKMIAADVNGNNRVSASDLIDLRKIILGIYEEFPGNTSWRFIPSNFNFESADNPWGFPEDIMIDELLISKENINFIALKTGDINGTATSNSRSNNSTRSVNKMALGIKTMHRDNSTVMTFSVSDIEDILGLQFTLDLGQYFMVESIEKGLLDIKDYNFNITRSDQGYITFSWNDIKPISGLDGGALFSIIFKGKIESSSVSVTSEVTQALGYDGQGEEYELLVNRIDDEQSEDGIKVYQNYPNPFSDETDISVNLPDEALVDVVVYDISGRKLMHRSINMHKGMNTISIKKSDINSSGVMYYQISTDAFSKTKKMIILD